MVWQAFFINILALAGISMVLCTGLRSFIASLLALACSNIVDIVNGTHWGQNPHFPALEVARPEVGWGRECSISFRVGCRHGLLCFLSRHFWHQGRPELNLWDFALGYAPCHGMCLHCTGRHHCSVPASLMCGARPRLNRKAAAYAWGT